MAKIVFLFALAAFVQVATALDCYACDKTSCHEEMSRWQKVMGCGKTTASPSLSGACLRQTYTDKNNNKEVTIRKCVIADKKTDGTVTHNCNDSEGKTSVCEVCTSDFCNSASAVNFSFVTILGVVAVYLIPKFM